MTDHDTGERRVTDILLVLSGPNAGECFVQLPRAAAITSGLPKRFRGASSNELGGVSKLRVLQAEGRALEGSE